MIGGSTVAGTEVGGSRLFVTTPSPPFEGTGYLEIAVNVVGDNTLLDGIVGEKINVVAVLLVSSGGSNSVRFKSGATGLTGVMELPEDEQFVLPFLGLGWFETAVGEALVLELSSGTLVAGCLVYRDIEP